MLVRGALCRLAGQTTPHDLPQLAHLLQRTLVTRSAPYNAATRTLSHAYSAALQARRSYATTRAIEPTATVKKAVKARAAKTPGSTTKVASATKTRSKAKTGTTAASAKKPAAKKAAPKKKKKAAVKKAAPRKRVKKELNPEQKEKAKIAALRKKALQEPVSWKQVTGINAFVMEQTSGKKSGPSEVLEGFKAAVSAWPNLTPAEHEVS